MGRICALPHERGLASEHPYTDAISSMQLLLGVHLLANKEASDAERSSNEAPAWKNRKGRPS